MPPTSGIYVITNIVNGKRYIGSAKDVRFRKWLHLTALRANKHYNSLLQHSWNKYGESSFSFSLLIICRVEDLLMYEQAVIDGFSTTNRGIGFNLAPKARSPLGVKWSEESKQNKSKQMKGRKLSPEHRAKVISILRNAKPRKGFPSWNKGRPWNEKEKEKLRAAKLGKKKGPYKRGNVEKTRCPRGHPYSGDNLYVSPSSNKRSCRECIRINRRERRWKKRQMRFSCDPS